MEPVPPIRRKPRQPVEITFSGASEAPSQSLVPTAPPPSLPPSEPPPALPRPAPLPRRESNSIYHVQKALMSGRVIMLLATVGGWIAAGAQYVSGTARQSDLDVVKQDLSKRTAELEQVRIDASAALTGAQQCVKQQGEQALAMRAIIGLIARQRGRTDHQKRNEQAAAESRYNTALGDGKPLHEAARIALSDQ